MWTCWVPDFLSSYGITTQNSNNGKGTIILAASIMRLAFSELRRLSELSALCLDLEDSDSFSCVSANDYLEWVLKPVGCFIQHSSTLAVDRDIDSDYWDTRLLRMWWCNYERLTCQHRILRVWHFSALTFTTDLLVCFRRSLSSWQWKVGLRFCCLYIRSVTPASCVYMIVAGRVTAV